MGLRRRIDFGGSKPGAHSFPDPGVYTVVPTCTFSAAPTPMSNSVVITITPPPPPPAGGGLPAVQSPVELPVLLANPHSIAEDSMFARVVDGTGHSRMRRLYTASERTAQVAWHLSAQQMLLFDYWFELNLSAGTQPFSLQMQDQSSSGLLWWKARFQSPPQARCNPGGDWLVTATLRLYGAGSVTGPVTTGLGLSLGLALAGSAALTVSQPLVMSIDVSLIQTDPILPLTFNVALT